MKFIDLFAGIGGFRLAAQSLGWKCVFSSELDKNCQKVYGKNFGHMPSGDIKQIDINSIPDFDLMTAGFPCQPFSLCGKKEGFADLDNGELFFDIVKLLKVKRPKMILLENVKGILNNDRGNTVRIIHESLEQLGYFCYSKVLDTYDFGLPQYRQRWFCVGFLEPLSFSFPLGQRTGLTLRSIIEKNNSDANLTLARDELDRIDFHFENYQSSPRVKHKLPNCSPNSKKAKYGVYSFLKPDNALRFHTGDPAKSQIQDDYYVSVKSVAPAIIATRAPKLWDLRRHLSVLECQRLQGFPDDFDFSDVSIRTAKKQLGNSVSVPVIKEILKNMQSSLIENKTVDTSYFHDAKDRENLQKTLLGS